ncbi:hypothetical protein QT972_22565 [Microcoleus sp. herbarium7]|uniref:hypothetical protein n=1 Tax=Microcoleus sp. herbarium7 TaxID=3055435 RepID=UPI002FD5AC65
MTNSQNNPGINSNNINSDSFLIQEDEKVFELLNPPNANLSKLDEISGMIAYAHYSIQKHQFVKGCQQSQGKMPTEDALKSLIFSFQNENNAALSALKIQSKILLNQYAQEYLEKGIYQEILEPIEKVIEKRTSFWSAIGTNLFGSVIYSFVIALIVFTTTAAVPNTKFSRIFKILMEESPNPTYPANPKEKK